MKLAYAIITHKNPYQTLRLVERLNGPDAIFFIHVDRKAEDVYRILEHSLSDSANTYYANRVNVKWGTISIFDAKLECLRKLCQSGESFEYVVMLSGQDYPLADNDTIKQALARYQGKDFVDCSPLPISTWGADGGFERFSRYHFRVGNWRFTFPPRTPRGWKGIVKALFSPIVNLRRKLPFGYIPHGGSDWWCLSRDTTQYICALFDRREGKILRRRFTHTENCTEILFQTVVANSPFRDNIVDYYPWHIDWSTNGLNPATLTSDDFDVLAESGKLFARKFDESIDSQILDRLDRDLIGIT